MGTQLSKLCADHLRTSYLLATGNKLKASHARELAAAFFGYKSHAALLAERNYPIDELGEAHVFIPDVPLIESRMNKLTDVPKDFPTPIEIAKVLTLFLTNQQHTNADIWLYDTLESYCLDELLVQCQPQIDDELAGVMAETNAGFWEQPWYEIESIVEQDAQLVINASAQHKGEALDDKPFCGDTIDFQVQITLPRVSGKRGFFEFHLAVGGEINDDWVDPELKYGSVGADKAPQPLAEELGLSDNELQELIYDVYETPSNDGLVYGYVIQFADGNPPELLAKISGLNDENEVRVGPNAFDEAPGPFDMV